MLGATLPVAAEGLRIAPFGEVQQMFTTNARLSATEPATNDSITRLSAGVGLQFRRGRTSGFLDYTLSQLLYARESDLNTHQNTLNARMQAEVVEGHGFINAMATVGQGAISAFGAQPGAGQRPTANSTEVRTLRIQPRWVGLLTSDILYELRTDQAWSNTASQSAVDGRSQSWTARLASDGARVLGWTLDAVHESGTTTGTYSQSTKSDRLTAGLNWTLTDLDLVLGAHAGQEWSDALTGVRHAVTIGGVSARWTPSPRTSLDAGLDHREFGQAYRVAFDYRTPRTIWHVGARRDLNNPALAVSGGVTTLYDLYFAQFSGVEPDPIARASLVNAFLQAQGLQPNLPINVNSLLSSVTKLTRFDASVGWRDQRSSATLVWTRTVDQALSGAQNPSGDFAGGGSLVQRDLVLQLGYRLDPLTGVSLNLADRRNRANAAAHSLTQRTADLALTGRYGPRLGWSVMLRRGLYELDQRSYGETALILTASLQF